MKNDQVQKNKKQATIEKILKMYEEIQKTITQIMRYFPHAEITKINPLSHEKLNKKTPREVQIDYIRLILFWRDLETIFIRLCLGNDILNTLKETQEVDVIYATILENIELKESIEAMNPKIKKQLKIPKNYLELTKLQTALREEFDEQMEHFINIHHLFYQNFREASVRDVFAFYLKSTQECNIFISDGEQDEFLSPEECYDMANGNDCVGYRRK